MESKVKESIEQARRAARAEAFEEAADLLRAELSRVQRIGPGVLVDLVEELMKRADEAV